MIIKVKHTVPESAHYKKYAIIIILRDGAETLRNISFDLLIVPGAVSHERSFVTYVARISGMPPEVYPKLKKSY